jgi:TonB family protein
MRDLPFSALSDSGLFHQQAPASSVVVPSATSAREPGNSERFEVLRQVLNDETQSTESILTAIASVAHVLSGADGTALALNQNGTIVCRSRSGTIAPELGSPVSTESGISAECLRTATILVCSEALRDDRVDPDVCRALGIRSIAVVPLCAQSGLVGILEAFSAQPGAFENEHLDCLRALAEIAAKTYEREQRYRRTPPQLFSSSAAYLTADAGDQRRISAQGIKAFTKKHYRSMAAVAIAALLVSGVVRMSWRQTQAEIAATELPVQTQASPVAIPKHNSVHAAPQLLPLPTGSRSAAIRADKPRAGRLLQDAAELSPATDRTSGSRAAETAPAEIIVSRNTKPAAKDAGDPASSVEPPAVDLVASASPGSLSNVVGSVAPLPRFERNVFRGFTAASLIHKVEPVYPAQARMARIAGSVMLDATIATDGTVRSAKVIDGPTLLTESAVAAVRRWRFSPAVLDGKPTEMQARITIVFKLP